MKLHTFLSLAKQYSDLGWATQQQMIALCDGDSPIDQNTNAMRMCERLLKKLQAAGVEGVDDVIADVADIKSASAAE